MRECVGVAEANEVAIGVDPVLQKQLMASMMVVMVGVASARNQHQLLMTGPAPYR